MNDMSFKYSFKRLSDRLFAEVRPTPVERPNMRLWNEQLAAEVQDLNHLTEEEALEIFSGNLIPDKCAPFAQAYAGHQFGHLNMLGDGRAIHLGELSIENLGKHDIQLKGAGPTPFSRRGDGRGTYASMLREYLISEAMHYLGIPTTRSLCVVESESQVVRDEVYNSGILTRVAKSHIRVGTFEYASRIGQPDVFKELVEYTIDRHYPEVKNNSNPILSFFTSVRDEQILLVNDWMRVGFIHGVMNTDNMTISGETIDYGPCAFMNKYDPFTVFSSIDSNGRYAFENQKPIAKWNLMRLAESLIPLVDPDKEKAIRLLQDSVDQFDELFDKRWLRNFSQKIGLPLDGSENKIIISDLLDWMKANEADFTNTFRGFVEAGYHNEPIYKQEDFKNLKNRIASKWDSKAIALQVMEKMNPSIIPRNHIVENVLQEAAEGDDLKPFKDFLQSLKSPYRFGIEEKYKTPPVSEKGYKTFCGT